ncbi:FAD-dependent monooxygenase [Streptomyces sp. H27-G5]|uniref:FAD-dependent monooxygenase n=1 Tax=Streptomyces sp. H27-G5 TaxID=2996698 RepID=UPI00226FB872|nr:FAD-dependent monooxygenase [Streptomyces sp. H27-G5]MCY0921976.1 FAD-dependent monooxygenase [Streptomyces sp. H27-G5]
MRRSVLDPLIRSRAARTPGVDLLLGHRVTALVREAERTAGVRASTGAGEREIGARLVVGADGKDSAVAKLCGVPSRLHENGRFGYLAHFRGLPLHGGIGHTWFLEPDMAYAFPNDDGVTVLAVLPDKKRLPAFREDLEGSFFSFVRALPQAPPIDDAERISKIVGTVDYPLVSRRPTAPGVAWIGDAALTGDPLWGVGCGWALQSAQWLTEAVAPAATRRGDLDRSLAVYARRHRRRLRGHQSLAIDYARMSHLLSVVCSHGRQTRLCTARRRARADRRPRRGPGTPAADATRRLLRPHGVGSGRGGPAASAMDPTVIVPGVVAC